MAFPVGVLFDAGVVLLPPLTEQLEPMTMGLWFLWGQTFAILAYSVLTKPRQLKTNTNPLWPSLYYHFKTKLFLRSTSGHLGIWLILISVTLSGPTIAAVIVGAWPIGWTFMLRRFSVDEDGARYYPIHLGAWLGLLAAFVGCTLTVLAQPPELLDTGWLLGLGVCLALLGIVVDSQCALSIPWGYKFAHHIGHPRIPNIESWTSILGTGMSSLLCCLLLVGPVTAIEGNIFDSNTESATLSFLFGCCVGSVPSIMARLALTRTPKSTVTSWGFLSPAISVMYLALFGLLEELNLSYLLSGVALVMIGSLWAQRTNPVLSTKRKASTNRITSRSMVDISIHKQD